MNRIDSGNATVVDAALLALASLAQAPPPLRDDCDDHDDAARERRLRHELSLDPDLAVLDLEVRVLDGVARLRGQAPARDRLTAVAIARGQAGIERVRDEIEILSPASGSRRLSQVIDDALITMAVSARLLGDARTQALGIGVSTRHGAVTLSGRAPSRSLRQLALRLARQQAEVVDVVDAIAIDS